MAFCLSFLESYFRWQTLSALPLPYYSSGRPAHSWEAGPPWWPKARACHPQALNPSRSLSRMRSEGLIGGNQRRPFDPALWKSKGSKMLKMLKGLSGVFLLWGAQGVLSKGNTDNGMRKAPTQGQPRWRTQQPPSKPSASKQKLKTKSAVHLMECLAHWII